MGLLFIAFMISFFIFMFTPVTTPPDTTSKTERCPPHKWIYGTDDHLVCEVCHNKPGYNPRE